LASATALNTVSFVHLVGYKKKGLEEKGKPTALTKKLNLAWLTRV